MAVPVGKNASRAVVHAIQWHGAAAAVAGRHFLNVIAVAIRAPLFDFHVMEVASAKRVNVLACFQQVFPRKLAAWAAVVVQHDISPLASLG
jgi:hypothetical protein